MLISPSLKPITGSRCDSRVLPYAPPSMIDGSRMYDDMAQERREYHRSQTPTGRLTTPQEVAVGDALRGAKMFEKVQVPVIGVVENMSGFVTPNGERIDLFGSGGGQRLADELRVPLLGQVPLQLGLADSADHGTPVLSYAPDSPAAQSLRAIAERVASSVAATPAISLTN